MRPDRSDLIRPPSHEDLSGLEEKMSVLGSNALDHLGASSAQHTADRPQLHLSRQLAPGSYHRIRRKLGNPRRTRRHQLLAPIGALEELLVCYQLRLLAVVNRQQAAGLGCPKASVEL